MNYADTRDSEQLRMLGTDIDNFANQWKAATQNGSCPRQTVFFFPGGMASRLLRADAAYQDGVGIPAGVHYSELWLHPTTLAFWRDLEMHKDSLGCFRDSDDRIVVASGSIGFCNWTPHDEFQTWCKNNNADLFVFGWDWRRRLDETVTFFLSKFIPLFRQSVAQQTGADPLARFSLVGHSFGGMIVNLIIRSNDPILANMAHAVTVATPFYGYPGQVHRWFEGEPLLMEAELAGIDELEAADPWGIVDYQAWRRGVRQDMLEVVSSMPGLYTLHFLDQVTYNAPGHGLLHGDPDGFSLNAYPSVDATLLGLAADAYNPTSNGSLVRFPTNTGFDPNELAYARTQFQLLASPMPAAVANRFQSVRGVTTSNGVPVLDTAASISWAWISPSFDPLSPSPITDTAWVAGDDTQPAWTTRLGTVQNWVTVKADGLEHAFMMNNAAVVNAVGAILCAPPPQSNPAPGGGGQSEPVSWEEIKEFLKWLFRHRRRIKWPRYTKDVTPDFFPLKFRKRVPHILRRIYKDLVRGPRTKKPRGGKGKPGGRKPSGKRPTRRPRMRKAVRKR